MVRASRSTATASGTKTVTVSDDIAPDLMALVKAASAEYTSRPGEYTMDDLAEQAGMTRDWARNFINREYSAGRVTKRKVGKLMYYRAV